MDYALRIADRDDLPDDPREWCAAPWREALPEGRLELPEALEEKAPEAPEEQPAKPEAASEEKRPAASTETKSQTWVLRGSVVTTNSVEPNAKIEIWRKLETQSAFATVSTASGTFELELPAEELPLGAIAWARVWDEAGALRFDGVLRLEPEVVVTLAESLRWRGTVVCSWPRSTEELRITLYEPAQRAAKLGRRVGSALGDGIGYFELAGLLRGRTDTLVAELELRGAEGVIAIGTRAVSRAELESPAGARIPFDIAHLRLLVRNELGQAVPNAAVRFHAAGQASATLQRDGRTDGEGLAEFTVAFGNVEFDVRAAGFAPVWSSLEIAAAELSHELELKPLELEDRLFGTVLLDNGRAAEGALVVARAPGLPEGSLVAGWTKTDRDGTFELALPRGAEFEITATSGERLRTGPWLATVGDPPLVLTLESLLGLRVRLDANALPPDVGSGEVEYVAIERRTGTLVQGTELFAPFTIPGLAPGEWDVYVLAEGLDGCGTAAVGLAELQTPGYASTEVVVPQQRAHWVDALVVDQQRTPFVGTWAVAHGDWPTKVAAIFGLGQCDSTGRLRNFCDSRAARLELYAFPDEAPLEARVRTDEFAEIVLK
jgi:hypothetical protein